MRSLSSWAAALGSSWATTTDTTAAESAPARITSWMLPRLIPPMATTGTSVSWDISNTGPRPMPWTASGFVDVLNTAPTPR